jgi:hypothetical protein
MAAGNDSMTDENVDEIGIQEVPVTQTFTLEGRG